MVLILFRFGGKIMKKLLIIKNGSFNPAVREKHGDFEDCFLKSLGLARDEVLICSAYLQEPFPSQKEIRAIILTGSVSNVTENNQWNIELTKWLQKIFDKSIPILGVCYGHQILAHAMGGLVEDHPKGMEFGTVNIKLTEDGKKDPLMSILQDEFPAHVIHSQTVVTLPPQAKILAKNDFENHHAFVVNDKIWGVQFHPEFTEAIMHDVADELINNGTKKCDIGQIHSSIKENSTGGKLLRRFWELVKSGV